jgi:hypothetical protein
LSKVLQAVFEVRDQRKTFIAMLAATAASVAQKPNFNLEVELNDLWTRLTVLRGDGGGPHGGMAKVLEGVGAAAESMMKALAAPGGR